MQHAKRMLTTLERHTRGHHADADVPWLELVDDNVTPEAYAELLARTYGFEAPVEGALAATPMLASVIELRPRMRSGLIAQDLLALDLGPQRIAHLPQCRGIAPFASVAEALGWLYAVEHATRVHEVVRRHLAANLPRAAGSLSYLSAYGDVLDQRTDELAEALDRIGRTTRIEHQITMAAHAAFRSAHAWFGMRRRRERRPA